MKNSERFNRAIAGLIAGFFEGNLAKGDCGACAVGNIVAHCYGKKAFLSELDDFTFNSHWGKVFKTIAEYGQFIDIDYYRDEAKENIDVTGYSIRELAKVEKVFEENTEIDFTEYHKHSKDEIMQDQYNGLMAVVEVLCQIEGIENPKEYKDMFAFQGA